MPVASSVFPALSCTSFKDSGLIFRSLIHFKLILVQGDRHTFSFSFLHADNYFSQQHMLKRLSFLHDIFLAPLSKTKWAGWIHIHILYSVPLVFIFVFVPIPCCLYCYSSVLYFEGGYCDTSSIAPYAQDSHGYAWSFALLYEF
jgi:hypothetical protein